ncbi:MAG: RelA/SpoT family protein [Bacteriovoracaceae bacterium]
MIDRLDFGHERDLTIDELVKRVLSYIPDADIVMLKKAYEFAAKAHATQKRSSGEPYIIHPLNVAATLAKLRMDLDSIISGLLHDVVEDCDVSPETIEKEFNSNVAQIVAALTKISKIKFKSKEETQAENFRKMIVAMAKDLRVIIVKLGDRMHNMRTLQYVSLEKQARIAQETLDIYVPLASRLGINSVKAELEDLCLRFTKPEIYYKLAEKVAMKKTEREAYINEVIELVHEKLHEYSVNAEVKGRSKHFYSIYKKMNSRGVDFEQIQDLLAFRIVVDNITECYKTLGVIHSAFTPIPGRFKDYIAIPKVNNYQSLHTTVVGPQAERIEMQIRTFDMHEVAEKGVAAHWKYKEGGANSNKLQWVEDLLEFDQSAKSNTEVLEVVKNELDIGGIFIFTPKGDVFELKYGATPLDFAYTVHTEVGNRCVGAKVNGRMVPLKYRLKSGDTVEVLTSKTQTPTKDWLKIVKTSRAKTKINQWLLKVERDKNKEAGVDVLEKALKMFGTSIKSLEKDGKFGKALDFFKYKNFDELVVNIGAGKPKVNEVIALIPGLAQSSGKEEVIPEIETLYNQISKTAKKTTSKDNAVIVDGVDDVYVRMARCCNPIPGDQISGFITRGRGITIHTSGCPRINDEERSRMIRVEWNSDYSFKHPVNIRVMTHDKPGILSLISKSINNQNINIRSAIAKSMPDQKGSFIFEVEVKDYSELLKVISSIESMDEVISVTRV